MKPVIIGLGSNIEPEKNLPEAWKRLNQRVEILATSQIYVSAAIGSPEAPDFYNAAIALETDLSPAALKFEVLRPLEAELGRRRSANKNAPRTLDLDLVLYGSLILDDVIAGLRLPDPDLLSRAYLAVPCAEVAPEMRHPETGETLATLARRLSSSGEVRPIKRPRRTTRGGPAVPWEHSPPESECARRS